MATTRNAYTISAATINAEFRNRAKSAAPVPHYVETSKPSWALRTLGLVGVASVVLYGAARFAFFVYGLI